MTNLHSSVEFKLGWLSSADEGIAGALGTGYECISGHHVPDLDGPEYAANVIKMKKVLKTPYDTLI